MQLQKKKKNQGIFSWIPEIFSITNPKLKRFAIEVLELWKWKELRPSNFAAHFWIRRKLEDCLKIFAKKSLRRLTDNAKRRHNAPKFWAQERLSQKFSTSAYSFGKWCGLPRPYFKHESRQHSEENNKSNDQNLDWAMKPRNWRSRAKESKKEADTCVTLKLYAN